MPRAGQVWSVGDKTVRLDGGSLAVESDNSLRIYPEVDDEGEPDALWYLGLNRVVDGNYRSGSGLESMRLCFY
jgi:hypothetical protein